MKVIFDLDGTLCDISHRLHYIKGEKKDYDAFHAACVDDVPKSNILQILFSLQDCGHAIEIWSGRSDSVWSETELWLFRNGINIKHTPLKMRLHGDYTPDQELQRYWLHGLDVKPNLVFDDRQRVVDMWREEGITCCQVAAWEE